MSLSDIVQFVGTVGPQYEFVLNGRALQASTLVRLFGQSPKDTTRLGYISPEPARLNGNTFPAVNLPSAAARRCADHASSSSRFAYAESCL